MNISKDMKKALGHKVMGRYMSDRRKFATQKNYVFTREFVVEFKECVLIKEKLLENFHKEAIDLI